MMLYLGQKSLEGEVQCRVGGGVNPSPREEGKEDVGSYQYSMLNHLSPGAGGILIIMFALFTVDGIN